jgi:S-adenosylmethionine decarboxylase proenzyme
MTTAKSIATATTSVAVHHSGYAVDIRIFLAALTIVMTVSFIAGVSLGIPNLKPMPWMAGSALVPSFQQQQEEEHLPAGQHLLIDMEYVDADFLNSEERLTAAMVETITLSGLTMLSYHCHSLLSTGVSCVGVLLESHISFHTWPNDGVIALDLFTCGSSPLLPVIPVLERLFGVGDNVRNKWSHELRGFRTNEQKKKNYLDGSSDLTSWVLSPMEMHTKRSIYSNLTRYDDETFILVWYCTGIRTLYRLVFSG